MCIVILTGDANKIIINFFLDIILIFIATNKNANASFTAFLLLNRCRVAVFKKGVHVIASACMCERTEQSCPIILLCASSWRLKELVYQRPSRKDAWPRWVTFPWIISELRTNINKKRNSFCTVTEYNCKSIILERQRVTAKVSKRWPNAREV